MTQIGTVDVQGLVDLPVYCVVCGGEKLEFLSTAIGPRAYCWDCFHGWRVGESDYSYSESTMCGRGTSKARLERQIQFFAPFAPVAARVLEIGCATGELAEATRAELDVARYDAVELSPAGTRAAPKLDILFNEPLTDLVARNRIEASYDLLLMSHVLEHIQDVKAHLAAMASVLKSSGSVFLEVPNGSGNRALPIDDNRSHLHFFSVTSLTRLLASVGLYATAVRTDVRLDARYNDSIQVIAQPFRLPRWSPAWMSDSAALSAGGSVVVWGVATLAEEVLANFFDPERIAFFVDRDKEKQGTTFMGRPVLDPDVLKSERRTILINSVDVADVIASDIAAMSPPGGAHEIIRVTDLFDRLR